jgi:hypothetical protein
MVTAIKAIETRYKGRKFRSRLEARWAVFFDALGVQWEYEPEGFDLGEAGYYLPDFWLPDLDCWIEVKGHDIQSEEMKKASALAVGTGKFVFILRQVEPIEMLQDEYGEIHIYNSQRYFAPDSDSDGMMEWGICPGCGRVQIGHYGSHAISYSSLDPLGCGYWGLAQVGGQPFNKSPRLTAAYNAARSARFEHGESGAR